MTQEQKPKVKVYIDGANIFYTQKKLGHVLDRQKVKEYLSQSKDVVEFRYYAGIKFRVSQNYCLGTEVERFRVFFH